jgi:hypothetical protein
MLAASYSGWGTIDIFATLLVAIGVLGELWAFIMKVPFNPTNFSALESKKKAVEKWSLIILGAGVFLEVVALPENLSEVAGLQNQTAKLVASNQTNELTIEKLRKQNDELEANVSDRAITREQITNFIFLTEKIPKIPIKIDIGNGVGETESFATQVRNMLNEAGFGTPPDANAVGLNTNPNFQIGRKIGGIKLAAVIFLIYTGTTNDVFNFADITGEETNGFVRPIISINHTNNVYKAIEFSMSQIKISTQWQLNFLPQNPGECEIFIPQKSN